MRSSNRTTVAAYVPSSVSIWPNTDPLFVASVCSLTALNGVAPTVSYAVEDVSATRVCGPPLMLHLTLAVAELSSVFRRARQAIARRSAGAPCIVYVLKSIIPRWASPAKMERYPRRQREVRFDDNEFGGSWQHGYRLSVMVIRPSVVRLEFA